MGWSDDTGNVMLNVRYTYILEAIFPHPSLLVCLKGAAHIIAGDALHYEEGEELTVAQAIGEKHFLMSARRL